jgi:ubiquinone/menaquinone biosynthesis C-methylase UbiE
MMELGSGVGWIMEAMLEAFPLQEIVGLDISEVMIRRAQERLTDPRARFVLYDGFHFPFDDGYFDNIYSSAAIQHINKDIAFLLMSEIYRCLKPGGHATLHFLSWEHVKVTGRSWPEQAQRHIDGSPLHHLYLYTAEELLIWFTDLIGVSDFDVTAIGSNLMVHFSKGGKERVLRPDVEKRIRFHQPKPA